MILPTEAAMTTRRSSLSGTLDARIGLLCVRSVRARGPGTLPRCAIAAARLGGRRLRFLLLVLRLERRNHGRVGERRGIAQRPPLGDVTQEPAHDLAAPGLGQLGREDDVV